jgi:hypothetical protein
MENDDKQGKWTYYQISEARKQLQTYYSDQQNQQMTRLIGFVIGLFTLLQLTQLSKSYPLRNVFPSFPHVIGATYAPFWDFLKVLFLFFGVSLILFFILRTIFRYSLYGSMASWVMNVKDYEVKKYRNNVEYNEMLAFNVILSQGVYKDGHIFGLPANWFFNLNDPTCPSHENYGIALYIIISAITSLLLLLFLW